MTLVKQSHTKALVRLLIKWDFNLQKKVLSEHDKGLKLVSGYL